MATPDSPPDRRPIAARELKGSKVVASWMAGKGISPNAISVAGMLAGVVAGGALFLTSRALEHAGIAWIVAAVFVQLRLLANMFDGMVAIERGVASKVGELYNEIPDRVSDSAILIGLGYAAGGHIIWGYGAALAAMFTAYVRATGKAAGGTYAFCGPMAKQQRMFLVTLAAIFCAIAPRDWRVFTLAGVTLGVPAATLIVIAIASVLTALRRLGRIAAGLRSQP